MYQTLIFAGNLGRDPEMQYLPSGTAVTKLSVATNRTYYKEEEKITETIWFSVSVWGKQGENCNQYLSKGSKVLVEGILKGDDCGNPRIWTRSDGSPAASFEVQAKSVTFLSSREQQVKEPEF